MEQVLPTLASDLAPGSDSFLVLYGWVLWMEQERGLKPKTVTGYHAAVCKFLGWCAGHGVLLADVKPRVIRAYLSTFEGKGGAKGNAMRAIRSFYEFCCADEILTRDPAHGLKIKGPKYGPVRALNKARLADLFEAASRVDPRAEATFKLIYYSGGRIASVCALTRDSITNDGIDFIRMVKNDDPYWNPLVDEGLAAARKLCLLEGYAPHRGKRRPTLVGVGPQRVRDWLAEAGQAAGISAELGRDPWPHLLRATFCTHLVAAGVHHEVIRQLMNWRNLEPLARYSAQADELKREAAATALLRVAR